ncbi:hypothetical protein Ciccas_006640, partial [Cichlidogyrus casuarinus]
LLEESNGLHWVNYWCMLTCECISFWLQRPMLDGDRPLKMPNKVISLSKVCVPWITMHDKKESLKLMTGLDLSDEDSEERIHAWSMDMVLEMQDPAAIEAALKMQPRSRDRRSFSNLNSLYVRADEVDSNFNGSKPVYQVAMRPKRRNSCTSNSSDSVEMTYFDEVFDSDSLGEDCTRQLEKQISMTTNTNLQFASPNSHNKLKKSSFLMLSQDHRFVKFKHVLRAKDEQLMDEWVDAINNSMSLLQDWMPRHFVHLMTKERDASWTLDIPHFLEDRILRQEKLHTL